MARRSVRGLGVRSACWVLLAVTAACDGRSAGVAASVTTTATPGSISEPAPVSSAGRIDDVRRTTQTTRVTTAPSAAPTTSPTAAASTSPSSTPTSSTPTPSTPTSSTPTPSTPTPSTPTILPRPPTTSCTSVAHIGDSTGVYLWDGEYVGGDPANTIEARYRAVGVDSILHDDAGGRATVERLAVGSENAVEVAQRIRASGFRGCWVIMVGTNDAANLAAGASVGAAERIGRMLAVIDGDPVLWVDAMTIRSDTDYRNEAMVAWNAVLAQLDAELDHLAVADWSARAQPQWFQPDGIHLTAEGRVWRAAITALELAEAFPAS